MLPDSKFIIRYFPEYENIILVPLFDEHIGSATHIKERWKTIKDYLLKTPNAFCIIGGDMINNSILGSVASPFDDVLTPAQQKEQLYEELKPLAKANKILCGVPGNHELRNNKFTDCNPLYDVFCRLNIEDLYRESRCYLKLYVGKTGSRGKGTVYLGVVTHGTFTGKTGGLVLNKLSQFADCFEGVDFIVVGHSHSPAHDRPCKTVINPYANTTAVKETLIVSASSGVGQERYALKNNIRPKKNNIQYITLYNTNSKFKKMDYKD